MIGRPLTLAWDAKRLDQFDLPGILPPLPKLRAYARRGIMAQIILEAAGRGRPLYYSRRRAHYAEAGKRYSAGLYTFANVVPEIDQLDRAGLIVHRKAAPQSEWRSEFDPTPELLSLLADAGIGSVVGGLRLHEVIQRRKDGLPADYPDTARSRRDRASVCRINEAIAATDISVRLTGGAWHGTLYREGGYTINTACRSLYRVYCDVRKNEGARLYGPFWQNMRKADRTTIQIDGCPTVEPDYSCHHPSILYALEGKTVDGDAYDIGTLPEGVTRGNVKAGLSILLNADSRNKALLALANELQCEASRRIAAGVIEALEARHAPIARHFGTGVGKWLQYLDSEMTMQLVTRLLNDGIVVLPIHDSYRCRVQDKGRVKEEMARAFSSVMGAIS